MDRLWRTSLLLMVILFFLAPLSTWAQLTTPLAGGSGTTTTSLGLGPPVTACGQILTTTTTLPGALANFGYTQNGILTTEAGVAASAPTMAARLFVDYSTANGTDSGFAVVNPSNNEITLNVQLNNAQGIVTYCPSLTIAANGHRAMFASELCQGFIPDPFLGTLTLTSSTPFATANLQLATNVHGEQLYNSLPVATPNAPPAGSHLYFSQFADGGGFSTEILLMNLTGTTISGTVAFLDNNGHAVTLNFGPFASASTLNYTIPGNGMQKFTTTGSTPGTPLQAGAVVVTSATGALPSGAVVFSAYNGTGGLASQAGVLNSPLTTYSRLYVEKSNSPLTRDTGFAILNPNSSTATVQLNLVSLDGTFTAINTITLLGNNHLSAFVDESDLMGPSASLIPANFQGVLTLSSNVPVAPVTLRLTTNQRAEYLYSALPVVDLNNPPTGPLYLPQIANGAFGGGFFTTQIILINSSSSAGNITMNFFNDGGRQVRIWFSSEVDAAQKIAAGWGYNLALRKDGTVWSWGYNGYGELGNGTAYSSLTPVEVQSLTNTIAIAAGVNDSLALRSDGTVWAWGDNAEGELGNGTATFGPNSVPGQVQGLTNAVAIVASFTFSLALRTDGTVWSWGDNFYGELGDRFRVNRSVPVQVWDQDLTTAIAIAAGEHHSLALRSDGTVWAWGYDGYGQIGNGTITFNDIPVQTQGLTNVVAIAGGANHSMALKSDGTVWAWGRNNLGQLGNGTTTDSLIPVEVPGLTSVVAIAGGGDHSLALSSDGTVWAWGDNYYGQLGNGTTTESSVPVQVWGLTNAIAISAGYYHSLALRSDGTVWAWGQNGSGELGNGTTTVSSVPVQVQGF